MWSKIFQSKKFNGTPAFRAELNESLRTRGISSSRGQIILGILCYLSALSFADAIHTTLIAGTIVMNGSRLILCVRYAEMTKKEPFRWLKVFGWVTWFTSLFWSMATIYSLSIFHGTPEVGFIALLALSGVITSVPMALSPEKFLAKAYVFTGLIPLGIFFLLNSSSHNLITAVIAFAFTPFLIYQVNLQSRQILEIYARREQYKSLFHATMESIIVHDNGIIVEVNSAFEASFGYKASEIIGKHIAMLLPPEDHPTMRIAMSKDYDTPLEVRGVRKSGEVFPMETRGRFFDYGGKMMRLVCSQDLTSRKKAEEVLTVQLQHEKALMDIREKSMIETSKAKSLFLANMSHEIRTPLHAVISISDLLAEMDLSEKAMRYVRTLKDSGASLLALINDILDYSKIDSGNIDLEYVDFSLVNLIESQADLMVSRAELKNLRLTTYVDPTLPVAVSGDFGRLGQILANLISNAIKFTNNGEIKVRCALVKKLAEQKILIRFEVEDSGTGLSQDKKAQLFKPFVQADSSTARRYGGTGLGLSICHSLVTLMGGEISYRGNGDKPGTTFWFDVPVDVINPESISFQFAKTDWHQADAIIIEDGFLAAPTFERYLKSWNMPVTRMTAADFKSQKPDSPSKARGLLIVQECDELDEIIKTNTWLTRPRHILVVNRRADQENHVTSSSPPNIVKYLSPNIRQSDLYNALLNTVLISHNLSDLTQSRTALKTEKQNEIRFPKSRVLVAEDNSTNQFVIRAILQKFEMNVQVVNNGAEAVNAYQNGDYDLILMDVQMPEMDGCQATEKIRELEANKKIEKPVPIVALTANVLQEDRDACTKAGMNDFLSKPVKKDLLINVLERYLSDKME
ncbi:ATP-binding protein [Bdellovibrio sp. SKB1291214]|uniref:response regulator n=1 Tax=Bdellovibrio sp. SKB1291214 TaxID=1732569 RepID=UPI0011304D0E|nr:response regulator [Bdellovibrio sp. SKB1291214]UYL09448.1 ATP-binding protein [Bdellovibrio sp. SKB1291214]